ncbi:class I SAM-dependent methyltransferase [soil metagenome]
MNDFSHRSQLPEKMDEADVPFREIHQALNELETINRLLGGYHVILNALDQLQWSKKPVTIMDLGCGGGDMLRAIAKWAAKKGRNVNLIGVDRNQVMINFASGKSTSFSNIRFVCADVFDDVLLNENADVVMSSLFCHHFDDPDLIVLMQRMNLLASKAVIVNDIHRHWLAYYLIKFLSWAFSKTYLVKYDAPLSVARSLTRSEWESILLKAKLSGFMLRWMWAWRWQLIIKK